MNNESIFRGRNNRTIFVLNERIDCYHHKHKLAIEVGELGHLDRDEEDEIKRQEKLEKYLGCTFIRINPDEKDFDTFDKLGEIRSCIEKWNEKLIEELTKKSTKKSLTDNLLKTLLEVKFMSDQSIKSKAWKYVKKEINIAIIIKRQTYSLSCRRETSNIDFKK